MTATEYSLLLDVARECADYTATNLVSKTHEVGSPWHKTAKRQEISRKEIKAYFSGKGRIKPFDEILKAKDIQPIGRRNDRGTLVLPVEEYDSDDDEYWNEYLKKTGIDNES